ncbi:hypothetical protein JD292_10210 [Leucobacter sp. CSA2]|uniref:Uncharacterized protein n=1 Tax=Leucobacter edaphi TaxID=2796472 RepID=A0A934QD62_9MICO|nr:hypothetical protein [Leucobacter edaphi]MBK0422444.1 hypothetical protein [Leucobacter edaphi]
MASSAQQVTQDRKVAHGGAAARANFALRASVPALSDPNRRSDQFIERVLIKTRTPP